MIYSPERFDEAFEKVRAYAEEYGVAVHVFAGGDTDGLAATRILSALLRGDNILYKIEPVSGQSELGRAAEGIEKSGEAVALVLINCGGMIDVEAFFGLDERSVVLVVDSHRPYHLNNVYGSVCVLDDGTADEETVPSLDVYEMMLNDGHVVGRDDSDDDGDDDASFAEQREDDEAALDDDVYGDGAGVGSVRRRESGGSGGRKRQKRRGGAMSVLELAEARERALQARAIIERYYSGTYYGSSAATLMYFLATELNREENYLLWLGIVGLTDQYIHERIDTDKYEADLALFAVHVARSNPDDDETEAVGEARHYRITGIDEFRFMLFRHWTLYDSMFHSPYVAARLGIWQAPGRAKLRTMLAKMGLRLSEAKQKYALMSRQAKDVLYARIHDAAAEFGLDSVVFGSFQLDHVYSLPLSAADVVYATSALLAAPIAAPNAAPDAENLHPAAPPPPRSSPTLSANFWTAYDALHLANEDQLRRGLEHSIAVQRAIVRQGTSLIENRAIVPSGPFRYAFITDSPDLAHFVHPLSLIKLANFMVDTLRAAGKPPKPFVMAALDKTADSYLVVGVSGAASFGNVKKNTFGSAFDSAAEATNAAVDRDCWDSAFCDVRKEDMTAFMDHLHHDLYA